MSHRQRHRGQASKDPELFSEKWVLVLNQAVDDLSWLRSRDYADKSSLKIVGDRYQLTQRQRKALWRAYCTDQAKENRLNKEVSTSSVKAQTLAIDGFNLLISVESGLGGGNIFVCRDSTYRDIASIHSTYRKVEETLPALILVGQNIIKTGASKAIWYLDQPISNSGRLRGLMREIAEQNGFNWEVHLVNNPDQTIIDSTDTIAVSSDGWVLDHAKNWFNLHKYIIDDIPGANIISLRGS